MENILEVKNLQVGFYINDKICVAVDNISFDVKRGETLCIVGESGCGKSVTAMSLMKLLTSPPAKYLGGNIYYNGRDLLQCSEQEMRKIRGHKIAMIFQEPMTSLNPLLTVGKQLKEVINPENKLGRGGIDKKAEELLGMVGISDAAQRLKQYPHQMSGGMKQRIMIAMAIAANPDILIADEPTTALDVTIQAQILELLKEMKKELKMALIMITHDLGVVAGIADKVAVMYGGSIVETGTVREIFKSPRHPYTNGLLRCIPRIDDNSQKKLYTIPGIVPNLGSMPAGCKFTNRCPIAQEDCKGIVPTIKLTDTHMCACRYCSLD